MEYVIKQHDDKFNSIYVYAKEIEIIKVQREITYPGIHNYFYKDNVLFLKTFYKDFRLFKKHIKIEFQLLDLPVELIGHKRSYKLQIGHNNLSIDSNYFKNPRYIFYLNDIKAGEVRTRIFGLKEIPVVYHVSFERQAETNYYFILFLLMQIPVVMGP